MKKTLSILAALFIGGIVIAEKIDISKYDTIYLGYSIYI